MSNPPIKNPSPNDSDKQYEVTYWSASHSKRKIFGWADTPEGVTAMFNSIRLNPSMGHPKVRDREKNPDPVPPAPMTVPTGKQRSYDEPE